ncbi:MAG: hypothetical protein NTW27_07410 [Deltaproteobacteria bacterium]|nr:hypothetical protein [Deltaproteobacteria bacterium]
MTLTVICSLMGALLLNSIALGSEIGEAERPEVTSLYHKSAGGDCAEPKDGELEKAQELFAQTLRGETGSGLASAWASLGFNLVRARHEDSTFLVLMEKKNEKRGRGFYLFRDIPERKRYLIIPHRFTDEGTGKIGLSMFLEGKFPAAAWNTARRYPKGDPTNMTCDMARLPRTYFTAFTQALAETFPDAFQIQIHGFLASKRRTQAGESADMVISGGDDKPGQELLELRKCLESSHLGTVRVYPVDIQELGATGNISGQLLRNLGRKTFIHFEISHELREKLKANRNMRTIFMKCLDGTLQ